MADILGALVKKYEGDIAVHTANISVYQSNPAGIGEHPDVVAAVDELVGQLADAQDKLKSVKELQHPPRKTLVE
jgi:hypothetical protein|tara:strand:- start:1167 stop:1388 length:222 start_codon:yes stop_codon:yes gene_type:complete